MPKSILAASRNHTKKLPAKLRFKRKKTRIRYNENVHIQFANTHYPEGTKRRPRWDRAEHKLSGDEIYSSVRHSPPKQDIADLFRVPNKKKSEPKHRKP